MKNNIDQSVVSVFLDVMEVSPIKVYAIINKVADYQECERMG